MTVSVNTLRAWHLRIVSENAFTEVLHISDVWELINEPPLQVTEREEIVLP